MRRYDSAQTMICVHCSTPIPDGSRYCLSCGGDVSDPTGHGGTSAAAMDASMSAELDRMVRQEVGGEFEIERELGRGGMAVVYLATETHLGRKVAIKVLPPDLTFGAGAIDRFKREARTAATLDHPNIIPIYRVSPGGRLFWYAMKYLEGHSLSDVLQQERRLSLTKTIAILEPVASALDYAHRRNVIHRDIKPANIMLDDEDRVVITDFGIAKQLTTAGLTASGSAIGTPYYMSPEQCTAVKALSGAADQYSVGVMTYQMLAGALPFEGDSVIEILQKQCSAAPPPLEVLRPGLPGHVYGAIEKALSKKAEQRFPSVKAFVAALKQPSADVPTIPTGRVSDWKNIGTTAFAVATSRRTWFTALGLAAMVGAGTGGLALWRMNSARPLAVTGAPPLDTVTHQQQARDAPDTRLTVQGATEQRDSATSAPSASAPPPPSTTERPVPAVVRGPTTGRLTISGLPPQGTVFIDDQLRTGTSFTLPAGTHVISLAAPGFEGTSHTIEVKPGESASLHFAANPLAPPEPRAARPTQTPPPQTDTAAAAPAAPGVLVVRTLGGWARIYVDNALRREGTSHRDSLSAGTHALRLEREGYLTIDTTVTIRAGETQIVTITMRARQ